MDGSRFAPPGAVVADVRDTAPFAAPASVRWSIRAGWIAALFSAVAVSVLEVMALRSDAGMPFFLVDKLPYIPFAFAMAFGIQRKSRVCAVAMLAYFAYSKYVVAHAGRPQSLPAMLAFGAAYVLGVIGTFRYHRLRRRATGTAGR